MKRILSKAKANRWDQVAQLFDRNYERTFSHLAQEYRKAFKSIQLELDKLYIKIQKGSALQSDLYRFNRYYDTLNEMNKSLTKLGEKEVEWIREGLEKQYKGNLELITKDLNFHPVVTPEQVTNAINTIWCQDGRLWSDRLWSDKNALLEQLRGSVLDRATSGDSLDKLEKALMERMNVSFSNAERILRTELAYQQNRASIDGYKSAGIKYFTILHEPDACEDCVELAGKYYAVEGSIPIPNHPNCRCCTLAVMDN